MTEAPPDRSAARPRRLAAAVLAIGLSAGGVLAGTLALSTSTQAASVDALRTWTGAQGAAAGSAVSAHSCDFTGDGEDDIITSAWMWDRAPSGRIGAAYVIPNGAESGELDDPTTGILRIEGPQRANALTGFSVSCAGDVNGDGIDDMVIGEYTANRAWVVFGSTEQQSLSLEFLGDRGFAIERSGANDRTGYFTSGVGDIDGDGYDDVAVVSLQAQGGAGQVSIVRGRDDIATVDLSQDADVLLRINGTAGQGVSTVAPAGDVDGDGVDDLVVGGYVAQPTDGGKAAGMAWAVSGTSRGAVDLSGEFDGFTIEGPARGSDRLGMSVAGAGDLNCDGLDDLLIGADATSRSGGAAVVHGSAAQDTVTTDPTAEGLTVFAGEQDRGTWITDTEHGMGMGYAVSAVAPADGRTGTLVIGEWGSARAVALDSSVLDAPLVDVSSVADDQVTVLSGNSDRLGRGIGVIHDFGDEDGPLMVAGGDNVGKSGTVQLGTLPQTRTQACEPEPTEEPTGEPTGDPTEDPTGEPTGDPTVEPTGEPTAEPTADPTGEPTGDPTADPTEQPTGDPTEQPTGEPTGEPTAEPTADPTGDPTTDPTADPTDEPDGGGGPDEGPDAGPDGEPGDEPDGGSDGGSDDGDRGDLPRTGASVAAAVTAAIAIIGGGIALVAFTRRKRA